MIRFLTVLTFCFILFSGAIAQKTTPGIISKGDRPFQPFIVEADRFADIQVLRYQVPGFETLTAKQKELAYYLYEAALCGRDIIWDQKYRNNLIIRRTLEGIWTTWPGDKTNPEYKNFETYVKRVWFSNGIHHHYASDKILPDFSQEFFSRLISETPDGNLPIR